MNKAKNAKKTMLPTRGFASAYQDDWESQYYASMIAVADAIAAHQLAIPKDSDTEENIKLRHSFRDYTDIKEGVRLFSGEQAS